jgi:DsbC/DsbD-like thiol-disulfide interchange protein
MRLGRVKSAVALLLTAVALAQSPLERFNKASFVTMEPTSDVRVARAKPTKAIISFRVKPGYHVNSNQPGSDLLIPTEVKFDSQSAIVVGKAAYPAGEELALAFSPKQKLSVYQGDVAVAVPLTAAKSAKRGAYKLKGSLCYQACNDNACFPPKTAPFELNVIVQ